MSSILLYITGFLACSGLIIFSGSRLSKYGDIIAELSGMGKAWFGLIFMAAVTSLPELFTGIGSVVMIDSPDIAVGDIMGSCVFNLLILAVLDYFIPGKPLASVVTKSHVLAGFIGIFLMSFTVISIIYSHLFPVIGWFSSSSLLLIILYVMAMQVIFKNEQRLTTAIVGQPHSVIKPAHQQVTMQQATRRYVFFALLVIAGAISLPFFADHLANEAGLSKSFVGTLLVAASTSLPELVVSIAAVRISSVDIAVGNLLGSNIFNMLILSLDDLMYRKGPLLQAINPNHALSGLVTLLMTAVVGISIIYGNATKRYVLGIDAILLIVLYALLIIALYVMG